jgi:hypothetical protein
LLDGWLEADKLSLSAGGKLERMTNKGGFMNFRRLMFAAVAFVVLVGSVVPAQAAGRRHHHRHHHHKA